MIDSHTHVHFEHFDADRDEVLARAWAAGVTGMVLVGTCLESSRRVLELARGSPRLRATAGVHPHDAAGLDDQGRAELLALARGSREIVALGETGLDFFRDHSPRDVQRRVFAWHLDAAQALGKPIVIHSRDATDEMRATLAERAPLRGVMHCFSGSVDDALFYCGLGLHVSFAGQVTYPKNGELRAAARAVPLERLLVETDAPYLAPQAMRGRRNEPAFVAHTVACIAVERGLSHPELGAVTAANARALFDYPFPAE